MPTAKVAGASFHAAHFDAHVTAVLRHAAGFAFATGDGRVVFATTDLTGTTVVAAHGGAILSAASDGESVLSGGDDGRVLLVDPAGAPEEVWRAPKGRWIDHVATRPSGERAWACGRSVHLVLATGAHLEFDLPSSIAGLAFAPKSSRLAASHFGGVTVWDYSATPGTRQLLEWKGSHLSLSWSLNEQFLVTAMMDGALHGWRLADGTDFEMSGYPLKPLSLSWSPKGDWLATSGTADVLLWPFKGKKGPMGKPPEVLSRGVVPVAHVAVHPVSHLLAAGFKDGAIQLVAMGDGSALSVRAADNALLTALCWSSDGRRLAYGTEDGRVGIVDFSQLLRV